MRVLSAVVPYTVNVASETDLLWRVIDKNEPPKLFSLGDLTGRYEARCCPWIGSGTWSEIWMKRFGTSTRNVWSLSSTSITASFWIVCSSVTRAVRWVTRPRVTSRAEAFTLASPERVREGRRKRFGLLTETSLCLRACCWFVRASKIGG